MILGGLVVAAAVLAALFFLFNPQLQNLLGFQNTSFPSSLEEFLPDEEMGYNKIDFTNAVLGETRKEKELIVLEQQQILTESIDESMRDVLETKDMYKLANETACMEVREIYQPVITAVSEEFVVKVIQ